MSLIKEHAPPCIAFGTTRLVLFVACYVCLKLFPIHPLLAWQVQVFPGNNWVDGWVRWDAMWYESIVDGSARLLPENHSNASFFPLYSWISWLFALPFRPFLAMPRAFYAGALVLSQTAFLIALIGVYRLAIDLGGRGVASRTVWLIAFFPFSFFFSAVYSDGLYLCFAVWSFYFAHARKWRLACGLAALALATRLTGLAMFPALVVEYLRQHNFRLRSLQAEKVAWAILALAPAFLATYFWMRYGNPLEFVHARQTGWQRGTGLGALISDFREFTTGSPFACANFKDCFREWEVTRTLLGYWYVSLIPLSVLLVFYARRTLGAGLCVWVVGSVVMALFNGLDGTGRFTAVLFPVFIALALLVRRRAAFIAACTFCVPFLLLFVSQFARWRPVL
jgi:hypothetical protein